jgi:hypothetical protein
MKKPMQLIAAWAHFLAEPLAGPDLARAKIQALKGAVKAPKGIVRHQKGT